MVLTSVFRDVFLGTGGSFCKIGLISNESPYHTTWGGECVCACVCMHTCARDPTSESHKRVKSQTIKLSMQDLLDFLFLPPEIF